MTQRALRARTPGGKKRAYQRAQRTHRVASWIARLAGDKNADRMKLPQVHLDIEVLVNAANGVPHLLLQIAIRHSPDMNGPDMRHVDHAVAIDRHLCVEVHLAPDPDEQLIARTYNIVRRDRHLVHRRERTGTLEKQ